MHRIQRTRLNGQHSPLSRVGNIGETLLRILKRKRIAVPRMLLSIPKGIAIWWELLQFCNRVQCSKLSIVLLVFTETLLWVFYYSFWRQIVGQYDRHQFLAKMLIELNLRLQSGNIIPFGFFFKGEIPFENANYESQLQYSKELYNT